MKIKIIILVFLLISVSFLLNAETENPSHLSFKLTPGGSLPVAKSLENFKFGGSIGLAGEYSFPLIPIFLSTNLGYSIIPIKVKTSLSIVSFGAGGGLNYSLGSKSNLKLFAYGGFYHGFLNEKVVSGKSTASNPFIVFGTGFSTFLTPFLSMGLEVSYRNYLGLYNGVEFSLGTAYHVGRVKPVEKKEKEIPPKLEPIEEEPEKKEEPKIEPVIEKGKPLELLNVEFDDIFPILFKYYDKHPVGRAVLRNSADSQITDITVTLFAKQYMDVPKNCNAPDKLEAGEEKLIELNALFTEKVLEITEGTKVAAEITLEYKYKGESYKFGHVETMRLYDRNATMWDDDRKASAFVTAKDPLVLKFSKNLAGIVKERENKAINQNLRIVMAAHEALKLYTMSYVVDPKTPYKEYSKNKQAVDFLQFPRQTLEYRAGDCDDLSILYSALLESVGIETAFITIPEHIFMAFSLDMNPDEARKSFLRADEFIFREEKTWIPVEVTESGDFLKAWEVGAKEWREAVAREKEGFFPIHESWKIYEPVGLPGSGGALELPSRDRIINVYLETLTKFIDRQIYPQVASIQAEIKKSGENPREVNKLGVLYAKYGLLERAENEFNKILIKDSNYVPALLNLGNLYFLKQDRGKALTFYEKAYENAPDNPKVLLAVARANHELENYGTVKKAYDKLKSIDQNLAMQFAYLDLRGEEAARAADIANVREVVIWEE